MAAERMTDEEFEQLRSLLRRYCATELDQWELWKTETPYGTAFVDITRVVREGTSLDTYVSIDVNQ
jgi:hypothetical protein